MAQLRNCGHGAKKAGRAGVAMFMGSVQLGMFYGPTFASAKGHEEVRRD